MPAVREVEYADLDAVGSLTRAEGWGAPTATDWRWLWRDNPALEDASPRPARGWVLVDDNQPVGFLSNVVQRYELRGRRLLAATAAGLVVTPKHRGSSLQLMLAHAKQHGVDLLLNTTAAPHVSKISEFLKFRRIPQPDVDRSFYWVLRPGAFAGAALRKKRVPAPIASIGAMLVGPAIFLEGALRRRGRRSVDGRWDLRTITAETIGPEFDTLWNTKRNESPRLLAVRDARTLRWHFAGRGRRHPPFLVCAYKGARLAGYLAVVRQDATHLGLTRARVADIVVEHDDTDLVLALLSGAAASARADGAAMLEVAGFPTDIRRALQPLRPFELVNDSWPFLYKSHDPTLESQLAAESLWYASLFDGDGSI